MYDDDSLKSCCSFLENSLKTEDLIDIDRDKLFLGKFLKELLPDKKMGACDVLNFLVEFDNFPNARTAHIILQTVLITVASAERSFSKLKLLKSYLRTSISRERLSGLALIAIENSFLEE